MRKFIWAFALLSWPGAANACIPDSEYDHPTNYEFVESADAIIVATALTEEPPDESGEASVRFRTDIVLKGEPPSQVMVWASGLDEPEPRPIPDPPDTMPGQGCSCSDGAMFVANAQYVLFLEKKSDGTFTQHGYICAPWHELFGGERSLWIEAIRAYVEIQAQHDRMSALDAMFALKTRLEREPLNARNMALAADIEDHLGSLSTFKPTAYLIDAFERLERGEPLKFATAAPKDPTSWKRAILRALAHGTHADASRFFERLLAAYPSDPYVVGRAIQFFGHMGAYRHSFAIIEATALSLLIRSDDDGSRFLLQRILDAETDYVPGKDEQAWRLDPYTAKAWPELALGLYTNLGNLRSEDAQGRVGDYRAIKDIPVRSLTDRPDLIRALADMRDERALSWAISELTDTAKLAAEEKAGGSREHPPSGLAIEVLVRAGRVEDRTTLGAVFCQSDDRRKALVAAFAGHGQSSHSAVFQRMIDSPDLTKYQRDDFIDALIQMAGRDRLTWRSMLEHVLASGDRPVTNPDALRCRTKS